MRRYTLAPSALADLDIARKAGADTAERLVDTITGTFPLLAAFPEMGRQRPNLGEGMRSFPVQNYRIYYRKDTRGRVRILHVRHSARDEHRLFGSLP
jgi:toxin ParE1/3/4